MKISFARLALAALCLIGSTSFAQTRPPAAPRLPIQADSSVFRNLNSTPTYTRSNKLTPDGNAGTTQQRLRSVPNFSSSFTFQGQVFPFTMVGQDPHRLGTTMIDTSYVPISFFFDEFVDQNGNNIVIDMGPINDEILHSPNFEAFPYTSGNTQFGDAVQRAEFFSTVKNAPSFVAWHTLLERPRILTPVQVEVPFFSSLVFQTPDGSFVALIDINFMNSQLNTLLQTEGVRTTELPLFVTRNTVYGDFFAGNPLDCCIGGFHSAFETQQIGNIHFVQTFAFATALDSNVANFVFGDPTAFADVAPLSHEVSEWMDDPFVNNIVPSWEFPGLPFVACDNFLETGDPVENLPNPSFPVTLHGFTYHPQTEALLQWFSRESPSSAIGGAYSYPGNNLTTPSQACPF